MSDCHVSSSYSQKALSWGRKLSFRHPLGLVPYVGKFPNITDLLHLNIFSNILKIKITHLPEDLVPTISISRASESSVVKNKSANNSQTPLAGSLMLFGQL